MPFRTRKRKLTVVNFLRKSRVGGVPLAEAEIEAVDRRDVGGDFDPSDLPNSGEISNALMSRNT
jgi:hypothetical protein